MSYTDYMEEVAADNLQQTLDKDKEYGGSWLKRGGVGAFMNLARKWDRIALQVEKDLVKPHTNPMKIINKWDVIEHALEDSRKEGIADDLADLVGYLLLVQAEIRNQIDVRKQAREADAFREEFPDGEAAVAAIAEESVPVPATTIRLGRAEPVDSPGEEDRPATREETAQEKAIVVNNSIDQGDKEASDDCVRKYGIDGKPIEPA